MKFIKEPVNKIKEKGSSLKNRAVRLVRKGTTGKKDAEQIDVSKAIKSGGLVASGIRGGVTGSTEETSVSRVQVKDPGKRQRIIFLAVFIVAFVFGLKWRWPQVWEVHYVMIVAAAAALITYVGLTWAFRFDVKMRGLLNVLPQPAIFIFGTVLFLEMFFFTRFERIYESIVFALLLLLFIVVFSGVFLTANILNVGTIKKIPLLQVGQTLSYVITLWSIYVTTFSFIESALNMVLLILILFVLYTILGAVHLSQFELPSKQTLWYALGISWASVMILTVLLMWPLSSAIVALAPAVVFYIGAGILMHQARRVWSIIILSEYFLILLGLVIVLFVEASWGIGGKLWE